MLSLYANTKEDIMFAYNLWQWIAFSSSTASSDGSVKAYMCHGNTGNGSIVDSCMVRFFRFTDLVL